MVAPQGVRSDPSVLDRAHCPYVAIYKEQRHYGRIAYQDGDDLKTSLWIPEFQKLPTQGDCTVRVGWSIRDQKLIRCKIDMPHVTGKSLIFSNQSPFKSGLRSELYSLILLGFL